MSAEQARARGVGAPESVAVVVVTFNRADLLVRMLAGLAAQTHRPDAVIVVDNASTDHTAEVLAAASEREDLPLEVITSLDNVGGAGGFRAGMAAAHARGFDRTWLMDDDVVPAPDCLAVLMAADEDCLMAVREDLQGRLCEKAALRFDLSDPRAVKPKTAMVETTYGTRAAMPERVALENVAFEGFLVRRRVVERIGLPDAGFFIFYDDVDFALRARARRVRRLGPARRRAGAPAALRPAARPRRLEGLLHVSQPVRGAPALRRERGGAGQAVADRGGRRGAQPGARRPGRGTQRDSCRARRAADAVRARDVRRLIHRVSP